MLFFLSAPIRCRPANFPDRHVTDERQHRGGPPTVRQRAWPALPARYCCNRRALVPTNTLIRDICWPTGLEQKSSAAQTDCSQSVGSAHELHAHVVFKNECREACFEDRMGTQHLCAPSATHFGARAAFAGTTRLKQCIMPTIGAIQALLAFAFAPGCAKPHSTEDAVTPHAFHQRKEAICHISFVTFDPLCSSPARQISEPKSDGDVHMTT